MFQIFDNCFKFVWSGKTVSLRLSIVEQSNIQIHHTKPFMKKEIVRWISIQKLNICDVMSLNNVCSIDRRQNRSVTTYSNDEMNHKI